MPSDDDADDERPSGVPLPPEDRLWRHPSELGPGAAGSVPPPGSFAAVPWPPLGTVEPSVADRHRRRSSRASVAAVSCLAGAVIAMGMVLATRPGSQVVQRDAAQPSLPRPVTSIVWKQFPTERVAAQVTPQVARLDIQGPKGWKLASAVLIDGAGTLVTSAELVRGSHKLVVTFAKDRPRTGHLAGIDTKTGIAVISVIMPSRVTAKIATTRPTIGEPTLMVGGPGPGSGIGTITTGNVRGLRRQLDAAEGTLHDLIEVDRPVLDDTTGGALVDDEGRILGICVQGKESALGYAVPIDLVHKVSDAIGKGGRVRWGHLGVSATDLDPGRAQDLGISGAAQLVWVEPGSPAARAGLARGDLVTKLGTTNIAAATDLVGALSEHHPDDQVVIEYRRGSTSRSAHATLSTN